MNNFKYSQFDITCVLMGREEIVGTKLSFGDVSKWLVENKRNLFGFTIRTLASSWSAYHFMRYETSLDL